MVSRPLASTETVQTVFEGGIVSHCIDADGESANDGGALFANGSQQLGAASPSVSCGFAGANHSQANPLQRRGQITPMPENQWRGKDVGQARGIVVGTIKHSFDAVMLTQLGDLLQPGMWCCVPQMLQQSWIEAIVGIEGMVFSPHKSQRIGVSGQKVQRGPVFQSGRRFEAEPGLKLFGHRFCSNLKSRYFSSSRLIWLTEEMGMVSTPNSFWN